MSSETTSSNSAGQWRWALLISILLALITSLPQIYLVYVRGSEWNGSCAFLDTDELPYAAYANALIDGRLRRNDPYTGKDNGDFETLFSIQFLPAYALALPARVFGVSAHTMFILLLPLATVASALMVWWLLLEITDNQTAAIIGAVGVLSLGTAAAHSPLQIVQGVVTGYDLFPFLRRYIPALPFPIFIASTLFTWRALIRSPSWAVGAGLGFAILVYSYFFLWTAAAAWFCTIGILWLIARPEDRAKIARAFAILIAMGTLALLPYGWMLLKRANVTDHAQLLEFTHAPDLFRAPELYGALVLFLLGYQVRKRYQSYRDPKILFAASFALAPFVVFNQQILTGHSLQPFHYEEFIANYWVVLSVFLTLGILRERLSKRIIFYLAAISLCTALMLGVIGARMFLNINLHFDQARAIALKLKQENLSGVVFASDFRLTNSIATTANNPVLWARHMFTFSNVDAIEQKKRYYQYLYYLGFDESRLLRALNTDFFARWEVFGAQRANPMLTANHNPITEEEISDAVKEYAAFAYSYDLRLATNPVLSYAVVLPESNLSNLDRWYERSEIHRTDEFVTYRLKLRTPR